VIDHLQTLEMFFPAYFHEDWCVDSATWQEAITEYLELSTPDERRKLSDAIRQYSLQFDNDSELERSLFMELRCYYLPSGGGQSAKAWMDELASYMAAYSG
jgi:hypothetical protein